MKALLKTIGLLIFYILHFTKAIITTIYDLLLYFIAPDKFFAKLTKEEENRMSSTRPNNPNGL